MDALLDEPPFSAVAAMPYSSRLFNSGVFVFEPSLAVASALAALSRATDTGVGGKPAAVRIRGAMEQRGTSHLSDQSVLNHFFKGRWRPLPYVFWHPNPNPNPNPNPSPKPNQVVFRHPNPNPNPNPNPSPKPNQVRLQCGQEDLHGQARAVEADAGRRHPLRRPTQAVGCAVQPDEPARRTAPEQARRDAALQQVARAMPTGSTDWLRPHTLHENRDMRTPFLSVISAPHVSCVLGQNLRFI